MMFSDHNSVVNPRSKLVYQDMCQPLSHYWIASSHNTYLLGNQISGESSIDGYIRALKEGCKCVECKIFFLFMLTVNMVYTDFVFPGESLEENMNPREFFIP